MILIYLIGILLVAGILAWLTARWSAQLPRWISLIAIGVDLVLAARIWAGRASSTTQVWLDEVGLELGAELWHPLSSCGGWP